MNLQPNRRKFSNQAQGNEYSGSSSVHPRIYHKSGNTRRTKTSVEVVPLTLWWWLKHSFDQHTAWAARRFSVFMQQFCAWFYICCSSLDFNCWWMLPTRIWNGDSSRSKRPDIQQVAVVLKFAIKVGTLTLVENFSLLSQLAEVATLSASQRPSECSWDAWRLHWTRARVVHGLCRPGSRARSGREIRAFEIFHRGKNSLSL